MIRSGRGGLRSLGAALLLGLAGCGTMPIDYPLAAGEANQEHPPVTLTEGRPLVVIAFSGGGSRAAALGAAVTARLDGVSYRTASGEHRLSEDIKIVSSVSGGSVIAADLALHGASADEAKRFEQQVQNFDGIGYLTGKALNPFTWLQLQFEGETRQAVLQQMLHDFLQTDASLTLLNQPGQPLFLFNATDMVAGEVFTFTPTTLGDICTSYARMPLVAAVSASANFPFAFTPMLIKNDSYPACPGLQPKAGDWQNALKIPSGRYANLTAFRDARYRQSLRNAPDAFRQPLYIRLVDGGVADNLGLTSIHSALMTPGSPAYLPLLVNDASLRKLVVVVVNARGDARNSLDSSPAYTTLVDQASAVSGVLVDRASAGSATIFNAFLTNLAKERADLLAGRPHAASYDIYPIDIDFDQLPNGTKEERDFQNAVKSIATSWTLAPGDVDALDHAAGELLWRHPCFRKLLQDLHAIGTAEAPPVPDTTCPIPPAPGSCGAVTSVGRSSVAALPAKPAQICRAIGYAGYSPAGGQGRPPHYFHRLCARARCDQTGSV